MDYMGSFDFQLHESITTVQQKRYDELSPEEEDAFYKKAFSVA